GTGKRLPSSRISSGDGNTISSGRPKSSECCAFPLKPPQHQFHQLPIFHQPCHAPFATLRSHAAVYMAPSVLTMKMSSLPGSRDTAATAEPGMMAPVKIFHQPRHCPFACCPSQAAVYVFPSDPATHTSNLFWSRHTAATGLASFATSLPIRHPPLQAALPTLRSQAAVYTAPSLLTRKMSSLPGSRETAPTAPPLGMAPVKIFHQPRHCPFACCAS